MIDIGFKSEGLMFWFDNKDLPESGSNIDIFLEKEDTDGNITLPNIKLTLSKDGTVETFL